MLQLIQLIQSNHYVKLKTDPMKYYTSNPQNNKHDTFDFNPEKEWLNLVVFVVKTVQELMVETDLELCIGDMLSTHPYI